MQAVDEAQLERWIDQRTSGRIHRLDVETVGDRVIVHGCTSTHYARQLALAAALDVLRPGQVELDICVCAVTRGRP
jgi:hypothetical protein